MTAAPFTVSPDTDVWTAWSMMICHGVRHLLVTSQGRCVGVLDDRTMFAQWPLGPTALRRQRVGALMRDHVPCVRPDTAISEVAALMLRGGIDAIPVVDDNGAVVGVLTCSDVLAVVAGI
jgi:CBS domain-containing protein